MTAFEGTPRRFATFSQKLCLLIVEMGVLPELARAVDEMEWTLPTDIQAEAIPLILGGGDVLLVCFIAY